MSKKPKCKHPDLKYTGFDSTYRYHWCSLCRDTIKKKIWTMKELLELSMKLSQMARTMRKHIEMLESCVPECLPFSNEFWTELFDTQNKIIEASTSRED